LFAVVVVVGVAAPVVPAHVSSLPFLPRFVVVDLLVAALQAFVHGDAFPVRQRCVDAAPLPAAAAADVVSSILVETARGVVAVVVEWDHSNNLKILLLLVLLLLL
jgi:hypothetical protein